MAAGGPASELIMFIVAVIIAGTVAGALAYVTTDIAHGINDRGEMLADQLRTDFAIINDPNSIPVDNTTTPYTYTFYIKNVGKKVIPFSSDAVQVFIDGNLIPAANLTFQDVSGNPITYLNPYEVGVIKVMTTLNTGEYYRITIVLENGRRRSLVFRAP
ncbi:flagellar protein G [Thermococcus sp. 21S7]|uniref:flagellar protein G n=1 Tax=Thermococcus sp. 21S7 TaxID=1638221 RepID=UPI0014396927|nr:flagellar protein G [Thermococcus sp. 21S7]NJE60322.1 flagellar protein G [Thermococcus sp. 21S7]